MKSVPAFIVALVMLALSLAGYAAFRVFVTRESVAVATLSAQVGAKSDESTRVAAARAALSQLAGEEAAVHAYFVPQSGIVSFVDDLQSRGSALGTTVAITSISAASGSQRPTLIVSADVTGPFDAVMRTLGSIEEAPYDVTVTGVSVTLTTKGTWAAHIDLSVGSVPQSAS